MAPEKQQVKKNCLQESKTNDTASTVNGYEGDKCNEIIIKKKTTLLRQILKKKIQQTVNP